MVSRSVPLGGEQGGQYRFTYGLVNGKSNLDTGYGVGLLKKEAGVLLLALSLACMAKELHEAGVLYRGEVYPEVIGKEPREKIEGDMGVLIQGAARLGAAARAGAAAGTAGGATEEIYRAGVHQYDQPVIHVDAGVLKDAMISGAFGGMIAPGGLAASTVAGAVVGAGRGVYETAFEERSSSWLDIEMGGYGGGGYYSGESRIGFSTP